MTRYRLGSSKASLVRVVLAFIFIIAALVAAEAIAASEGAKLTEISISSTEF